MSTSTEVMQVTTALAQFDKVAAGLAELEKSYKGVIYPVTTKDGMKAAIAARRAVKEPRVEIEKVRKAAKAPILELGRKLDSEAARITGVLESLEGPIDMQIKQEEDRLHNEAVAKATAERERVEALEARLETLSLMPFDAQGLTSAQCQACLDEAKALKIGEDWQEFVERAERTKIAVVAALDGMVAKALAAEAEAARVIAERAELEQLRAKQAAADQAERERQAVEAAKVAAAQKAEAERLAAERAALEQQERERMEAHAKLEREARAAREAEQKKLDDQRAAMREESRINNIGFRAHQDRMTPEQTGVLKALSDASPDVDVYALVMPVVEPEIVLHEDEPKAASLTDAQVLDIGNRSIPMFDDVDTGAVVHVVGWTRTLDSLPADEIPVLIIVSGRRRIGELRWEKPGFEDTHKAFQYWDDPEDDGQDWEWHNVTHWAPLLEFDPENA